MGETQISQIRKRDGSIASFTPSKIEQAIYKALIAVEVGGKELAAGLTQRVIEIVEDRFVQNIPSVEDVQDIVEEVLMTQGYPNMAKAYILYRQQRADARRLKRVSTSVMTSNLASMPSRYWSAAICLAIVRNVIEGNIFPLPALSK